MCPDIISDIYVDDNEVQLHNPISDSVLEQICKSQNFTLNFKYKPCNCILCRNSCERIEFKKAIKWNSKMYNYYKKILKRLNDSKTYNGTYKDIGEMMLFHRGLAKELRFLRKQIK